MLKDKIKPRIIISVTNDLHTDNRVHKVAMFYYSKGYNVTLLGRKLKCSQAIHRPYKIKRFRLIFNKKFVFYAEYNIRLLFYLLFNKAEVVLSNDTDSLLANYYAAKWKKMKLIFDAHELFPEVPELVKRPLVKKIWTKIEDIYFPKLKYCYTVCQSIADYYNKRYNINMQVVRNFPMYSIAQEEIITELDLRSGYKANTKILLYQGAVNIGRGISEMIDAMIYLKNTVFYIVGDGDIMNAMKDKVKKMDLNDRVVFLGRIPIAEMKSITRQADLGINILENMGLSYYYSLPNRVADYVHAAIPCLTVNFPEIKRIIDEYEVGEIVADLNPKTLSETIEIAIKKWTTMEQTKRDNIFKRAQSAMTFENEYNRYLDSDYNK